MTVERSIVFETISTEVVLAAFLLGLLVLAGFAWALAAIAVAITGPRAFASTLVPAALTFVCLVGAIFVGRLAWVDAPLVVLIGLAVAFLAARAQRGVVGRIGDRKAGALTVFAGGLTGATIGGLVGGLGSLVTQSVVPVLFFVPFGMIVGLRATRRADLGSAAPPEPAPATAILDE